MSYSRDAFPTFKFYPNSNKSGEKSALNRIVKFSAVTKNCGERKNELTLVTLQSSTFIGPRGQKNSLLLKKVEVGPVFTIETIIPLSTEN